MTDMVGNMQGLISTALIVVLVIIGLIVWFFVNRASVRANRQIQLLEFILEEQKRQNVLLRKLHESSEPSTQETVADNSDEGYIRMIPER